MVRTIQIAALLALLLVPLQLLAAPQRNVFALVNGPEGSERVPLFAKEKAGLPIAKVGERVVTLSELASAIATMHEGRKEGRRARKKDFTPVLDRLIGVRLVVQEAQAIGLDEVDEVKKEQTDFSQNALREALQAIALRGVKADPREEKRLFQDKVREWSVRSALFADEKEAKALVEAVKAGGSFDALLDAAIASKKATGGKAPQYLSVKAPMLPQVLEGLRTMKAGQVSAPIKVDKGFAVLRVYDVRYPQNGAARAEAREQALGAAKKRALKKFYGALVKKRVKIDEPLFKSLDFEAKEPGFAALEKDPRVVATVEGGTPIKVSDVAAVVREAHYHGVEQAIQSKRINKKKPEFLDSLLSRQLVAIEVAERKIAQSETYKRMIAEHRDQALFAAFVQRVVIPEVKITEADLKAWYDAHKAEFTYPAMYRLQSLSFDNQQAADAARAQLKAGTDFKWMKQNAAGLVPEGSRAIDLDGNVMSARGLTPEVAKAVAGAESGDVRQLEVSGQHVVVQVVNVTPPTPQPYAETRETIAPKVHAERVDKVLGEWIAKLRKAHDVKVYITRIVS